MKRTLPPPPASLVKPARRIRPTDPLYPWETDCPYPIQWTPNGDYMEAACNLYNRELALAELLVEYLPGWSIIGAKQEKQGYSALHPHILSPEGWRMLLRIDVWKKKDRVTFSLGTLYWENRSGGLNQVSSHCLRRGSVKLPNEEITVSAFNTPEQMARAILSRFYPALKELGPRLLEWGLDFESYHWDTMDALNRAARALGLPDPMGGHAEFPSVYARGLKVEGNGRGRLSLHLTAEIEDMEKILRYIQQSAILLEDS